MESYRDKLREPLPKEALKQHPTKTFLTAINAIFVVERLNEVFGIGKWYCKYKVVEKVEAMVVVKAVLKIPKEDIRIEQFGGNDNKDLGDAYKGACTDALTKCASYLEIGIDVYKDKNKQPKVKKEAKKETEKPKPVDKSKPEKPWLNENTEDWHNAVSYLKGEFENDGITDPNIFELEKRFRISKANKEKLMNESIS